MTESLNVAPAAGSVSLTEGDVTTRSGRPLGPVSDACTSTSTGAEQLFVVSDSSATASTQAP